MNKYIKPICIVLLLLNIILLIGQLWPEGAPPFARVVNIVTLILNLIFIFMVLRKGKG
jgi:hypothetical protein